MGKFTYGQTNQSVAFSFDTAAPLDDRTVVRNIASLIGLDTWIDIAYLYKGLITTVQSTGEVYMCLVDGSLPTLVQYNALQKTKGVSTNDVVDSDAWALYEADINACWKRILTIDDLSTGGSPISGVFTFKGLAYAVSPDFKYIIVADDETSNIKPAGIAVDLEGEVYYGWEVGTDTVWTEEGMLTSSSVLYKYINSYLMSAIKYNGQLYFTSGTPGAGDNGYTVESAGGHKIVVTVDPEAATVGTVVDAYIYNGSSSYVEGVDLIGTGVVVKWTGYEFLPSETPVSIEATLEVINAAPGNEGHVYQIEDEEYASNGDVWVHLGSATDGWIIL